MLDERADFRKLINKIKGDRFDQIESDGHSSAEIEEPKK